MDEKKTYLMHANHPVAILTFDDRQPVLIDRVLDRERLPIGTNDTLQSFQAWYTARCMPSDRYGGAEMLEALDAETTFEFADLSYSDNLTDAYWIGALTEVDNGLGYQEISYRLGNGWGMSGNAIFAERYDQFEDMRAPDFFTNGQKAKTWVVQDERAYLLCEDESEQPGHDAFSMVASSEIARHFGIPHAEYKLSKQFDRICYNSELITQSPWQEMIPLWQLKREGITKDDLFAIAENYDFLDDFKRVILLDYLTARPSRDDSNIAIMRDAESMQVLGLAPLYGESDAFRADYNEQGVYGLTGHAIMDDLKLACGVLTEFPDTEAVIRDLTRIAEELTLVFDLPHDLYDQAIAQTKLRIDNLKLLTRL